MGLPAAAQLRLLPVDYVYVVSEAQVVSMGLLAPTLLEALPAHYDPVVSGPGAA